LKSSWGAVRASSFDLLSRYADSFVLFHDKEFVNEVLIGSAFDFCNDARAMMAEACGLILKLVFIKCMPIVDLKKLDDKLGEESDVLAKKLALLKYVLKMIRGRMQQFDTALILKGEKTALLHGLLSFFKHLFLDFVLPKSPYCTEVLNKKPPSKRDIHHQKNRPANMPVDVEEQVLTVNEFKDWRLFFTDLMETSLDINRICAGLLSNNRLD